MGAYFSSYERTKDQESRLVKLPDEILLQILKFLGPAASACLGVTCKRFYPIHREIYGSVSLLEPNIGRHLRGKTYVIALKECLKGWMTGRPYCFSHKHFHKRYRGVEAVMKGMWACDYDITPLLYNHTLYTSDEDELREEGG